MQPVTTPFVQLFLVAAATVVLAPLPALAQAGTPADADPAGIVERAAERYRTAGTVCADFRQLLSVPLLGQEAEGWGRLCQRDPNLFSMDFAEPAGDRIVVDGESIWVYYASRDPDRVLRIPVTAADGGRGLDFHRTFLEDTSAKHHLEHRGVEMVDGTAAHRIALRPRGEASYEEAVVWIGTESSLVHRVRVEEENGSVRTVELSSIEVDPEVSAGTFTFVPPEGVRVITPGARG